MATKNLVFNKCSPKVVRFTESAEWYFDMNLFFASLQTKWLSLVCYWSKYVFVNSNETVFCWWMVVPLRLHCHIPWPQCQHPEIDTLSQAILPLPHLLICASAIVYEGTEQTGENLASLKITGFCRVIFNKSSVYITMCPQRKGSTQMASNDCSHQSKDRTTYASIATGNWQCGTIPSVLHFPFPWCSSATLFIGDDILTKSIQHKVADMLCFSIQNKTSIKNDWFLKLLFCHVMS